MPISKMFSKVEDFSAKSGQIKSIRAREILDSERVKTALSAYEYLQKQK